MKKVTCFRRAVGEWESFPDYDVLWCDPPWGEGMLKLFARMARNAGHDPPADNLHGVLSSLFRLASTKKPLFVEYSHRGTDVPMRIAEHFGHTLAGVTYGVQTNDKPFVVLNFNTGGYTVPDNARGWDAVKHMIATFRPGVVFDPFAGLGKTAEAVVRAGATYIGSEMNPDRYRRLAEVAERLNRE